MNTSASQVPPAGITNTVAANVIPPRVALPTPTISPRPPVEGSVRSQAGLAPRDGETKLAYDYSIDASREHWRFIEEAIEPAQESQRATGVPASVTIGQAIHESAWGTSGLSRNAHNYFGIKANGKPGPAGAVSIRTGEYIGGKNITVVDAFRAYNNMEESFVDHGRFFIENERYSSAMARTADPRAFLRLIAQAGYATDPAYARKVQAYMDRFNLYRFDLR